VKSKNLELEKTQSKYCSYEVSLPPKIKAD